MNAIRRDEETDNIHSIYVDQWDWEKIITKEDEQHGHSETDGSAKCTRRLKNHREIHGHTNMIISRNILPKNIIFITSQELEDMYSGLHPEGAGIRDRKAQAALSLSCRSATS